MASKEVSLRVNKNDIPLDFFVQTFIDRTTAGMLSALRETCEIKDLILAVSGRGVDIILNGSMVDINPFVTRIIRETTVGMISALKGVGQIENLVITIRK